jgi:glutathione S-transferase
MMKLYYIDLLSARWVCAVARHLKAPVEFVYLDPAKGEHKTPAYVALNPNAKVPMLVKGDRVTTEADAIVCQLSEDVGADLWPHDVPRQIETIRWLSWNAQHFTRAGGALYFENIVKARFRIGAPDPAMVEEAQGEFRRWATVLSGHLKGRKWILGDTPTVSDFSIAMALPFAKDAQIPLGEFPEVVRWYSQIDALPAWRDPYPPR